MTKVKSINKNSSVKELAEFIISCGWNCSSVGDNASKATTILLHSNCEFLKEELERMGESSFNNYYGQGLMEAMELLFKKSAHPYAELQTAIKKSYEFNGYNWDNYGVILCSKWLQDGVITAGFISHFDNNFRGDIKKLHSVNGKFHIVETIKKDVAQFYVVDTERKTLETMYFYVFEHALFYAMTGDRYYEGMIAIFDAANKKEE